MQAQTSLSPRWLIASLSCTYITWGNQLSRSHKAAWAGNTQSAVQTFSWITPQPKKALRSGSYSELCITDFVERPGSHGPYHRYVRLGHWVWIGLQMLQQPPPPPPPPVPPTKYPRQRPVKIPPFALFTVNHIANKLPSSSRHELDLRDLCSASCRKIEQACGACFKRLESYEELLSTLAKQIAQDYKKYKDLWWGLLPRFSVVLE